MLELVAKMRDGIERGHENEKMRIA